MRTNRSGRRLRRSAVLAAIAALGAIGAADSCAGDLPDSLLERARGFSRETIVVDTHIDAPSRLVRGSEDLGSRTRRGEFDYVRARQGGLGLAFMSIFTSADLERTGRSGAKADSLITAVERLAAKEPSRFAIVRSVADVRRRAGGEKVLLALGMENGSPIGTNPANVRRYYDRGIRYITLAHAKSNMLADASYDTNRQWNGVSSLGRSVIGEMNRLGIMVDVSHLSDSAAFQAVRLSRAPVIASHSSCRTFTPGFERNVSDELIRAIASKGGVVQINFSSDFLDDAFRRQEEGERAEIDRRLRLAGVRRGTRDADRIVQEYHRDHPLPFPTAAKVADHIDHVVALVGVDYVGFGSDFDGAGDTFPVGLKDVSQYPNLIAELMRRGYRDGDLRKICGENLLRVWSEVERIAAQEGGVR